MVFELNSCLLTNAVVQRHVLLLGWRTFMCASSEILSLFPPCTLRLYRRVVVYVRGCAAGARAAVSMLSSSSWSAGARVLLTSAKRSEVGNELCCRDRRCCRSCCVLSSRAHSQPPPSPSLSFCTHFQPASICAHVADRSCACRRRQVRRWRAVTLRMRMRVARVA